MSVSPVDAILQIAVPSRPVDPAPRHDVESAFRPALEKAYSSAPTRSEPARREELEEPADPPQQQSAASRDANEHEPAETDDQLEPAASHDEQEGDESDHAGDAVEISEQAASAANGQHAAIKEKADDAGLQAVILEEQAVASGEKLRAESEAAEKQATGEKAATDEASAAATSEFLLPEPGEASEGNTSKDAHVKRATTRKDSVKDKVTSESRQQLQPAKVKPGQLNNDADQQESGGDETLLVKDAALETPADSEQADTQDASAPKDDRQGSTHERVNRQAEVTPVAADPVIPEPETSSGSSPSADDPATRRVDAANNNSPASPGRGAAALDRLTARSLRASERTGTSEGNAQIDRPRFVQRVEGAIRAAQQRDGRVQVRLSPPELGNLRIELAVQNGVLTAKLEAETPAARNTLLDNLPALRDRLAQQEIRIEKFEVDIRRDTGGSGGSGGPQDRAGDQSPSDRQEGRGKPTTTNAPVMRPASRRGAGTAVTDAGLDVSI